MRSFTTRLLLALQLFSVPLVFSAVVFGPLGGFAVGALSTALDLRKSPLKWSVYTPIRGLSVSGGAVAVSRSEPVATVGEQRAVRAPLIRR